MHHPEDMPNFFYALHCTPFFARRIKLCMGKGHKLSLFGILQITALMYIGERLVLESACLEGACSHLGVDHVVSKVHWRQSKNCLYDSPGYNGSVKNWENFQGNISCE